jgi:diaminopimelate epimerase
MIYVTPTGEMPWISQLEEWLIRDNVIRPGKMPLRRPGGEMVPFVKAHACGNDFLIVEDALAQGRYAELARKLCARNTGIGADGVEYVTAKQDGAIAILLFNADGSEAEISGNGTRCVAAWFAYSEGRKEMEIATAAGLRHCRVMAQQGNTLQMETEMGVPQVRPRTLRLASGMEVPGAEVSVGNPHFVIFVETEDFSVAGLSWRQLGDEVCQHGDFPNGTNVEFVRVMDKQSIAFRVYERGVGPTLSSGTGSCASAVASIALRGAAQRLTAIAEGGEQTVHWTGAGQSILLTGPATVLARGEAYLA